jgi:hypothetical protein
MCVIGNCGGWALGRVMRENRRISSAQKLRVEFANSKRWTGAKIAPMVGQYPAK